MTPDKKKLKVLFLIRRVGPYHHARFQAASASVDLTVIETRSTSKEYDWDFHASGSYKIDRLDTSGHPEHGLHGAELKAEIARVFNAHATDVVVTTGWADQEYHAAVLEANKHRLPLIVISDSRHEDEPRKFYKEIVKRQILKSYSAAIVAGSASQAYLLRLGFDQKAIFHPWDVVDNDYFASSSNNVPFSSRYFLCVSRFIPKKNLERLLAGYSGYLKNGGTRRLVLLGSGELEEGLKKMATDLEITGSLEMPGFMQYAPLKNYYAGALCAILPSTSDQWGLVVNEAMAAGLPVLVSKACGCAPDLVEHGKNGFIFDPLNTEELTKTMSDIDHLSEQKWKEMGDHSASVISKFSPMDFTQGLLKATRFATERPLSGSFNLIHKILGR